MEINLQDKIYRLEVSTKRFSSPKVIIGEDKITIFQSDQVNLSPNTIFTKWVKNYAKVYIIKRVTLLAKEYNFTFNKISIREQSTRWGSCSSQKNLNFNWKLILAPSYILDYVIIHELAHTIQMNHSKAFWDIVEEIIPNYRDCRKWLRTYGNTLKIY